MDKNRREFCTVLGASLLVAPLAGMAAAAPAIPLQAPAMAGRKLQKVRLLLNSPLSGPHAFFAVANERGYFAEAGAEVEFAGGDGASSVVPRIAQEGFDGGYGDLNSLIKLAAQRPYDAPVAVHATFNTTPLTIGVRKDGPIKLPKDLEGRVIGGHPIDSAIESFPAYAMVAGFDDTRVSILRSTTSMSTLAQDVINGHTDGVFGFVHTILAALAGSGIDGRQHLRFLEYRDFVPEIYGNSLMISPRLIRENPALVRGLVAALNRGVVDTLADPDAALEILMRSAPKAKREVDGPRLRGTLDVEMANPEGARIGIGDIDDSRLARSIELMVKANRLPRAPRPSDIFTREFLPPLAERARPRNI